MAINQIVGSTGLIERFGAWPTFHDAEVLRVGLDRSGANGPTAEMLIHTWMMTDEVDDRGCYVLEKHTLVRLVFQGIQVCELSEFNHQNVLFGLGIERESIDGEVMFRVTLDPSFGLAGSIVCRGLVVADVRPCDATGQALNGLS